MNVFEILIRERNEKEIDKRQAKANWSTGPRAEESQERKVKVEEESRKLMRVRKVKEI